jgi:hypothetical protein
MNRLSKVMLGVMLGAGSLAFADSITFNTPANTDLGVTHTFVLDGANIVATGFNPGGSGTSNHLFAKNLGPGDENGLGLVGDPTGNNEIWNKNGLALSSQDFIQLDVLDLLNKGFTNFQFAMDSTTQGETWQVSACASAGVNCSNGSSKTGTGEGAFLSAPVNLSAANHYLDFTSIVFVDPTTGSHSNVLLSALSATAPVPEPRFYGLLLGGLIVLFGAFLKNRRAAQGA